MEVVTKAGKIASTADRWMAQYFSDNSWRQAIGGKTPRQEQYELLKEAHTEDRIAEIIGNSKWTEIVCHECEKDVELVVLLGEEWDYESNTAQICLECLERALALASGREEERYEK